MQFFHGHVFSIGGTSISQGESMPRGTSGVKSPISRILYWCSRKLNTNYTPYIMLVSMSRLR